MRVKAPKETSRAVLGVVRRIPVPFGDRERARLEALLLRLEAAFRREGCSEPEIRRRLARARQLSERRWAEIRREGRRRARETREREAAGAAALEAGVWGSGPMAEVLSGEIGETAWEEGALRVR